MKTIEATSTVIDHVDAKAPFDEAELAAAAFLARYSGRTLDAYRHDLRSFFQWATEAGLDVLAATRPHIEMCRAAMERRGLAASTIDRRLSTVCGYYRFAHIDGRIPSDPAQYVRRPKVQPREGHGMDRGELGTFLFTAERFDHAHAALAVLLGLNGLRVSEEAAGAQLGDHDVDITRRGRQQLRAMPVALRQTTLGAFARCGPDRCGQLGLDQLLQGSSQDLAERAGQVGSGTDQSTRQLGQGRLIRGHRAVFRSKCGYFENRTMTINTVVMTTNSYTTRWDSPRLLQIGGSGNTSRPAQARLRAANGPTTLAGPG